MAAALRPLLHSGHLADPPPPLQRSTQMLGFQQHSSLAQERSPRPPQPRWGLSGCPPKAASEHQSLLCPVSGPQRSRVAGNGAAFLLGRWQDASQTGQGAARVGSLRKRIMLLVYPQVHYLELWLTAKASDSLAWVRHSSS